MLLHFREYRVDLARRELRRLGDPERLALSPLVLDLLLHLLQSRERVVSKEELVRDVWRQSVVSDATIARAVADLRRALGDDGRRQNLIRTVHGVGYAFVGDVENFVGRRLPLETLERAITEARVGRSGILLVTGEPGIGKTTLLKEGCRRVASDDLEVLWGTADEDDGTPALWPWPALLQKLVERRGRELLERSLGPSVEALAGLLRVQDARAAAPEAVLAPTNRAEGRFKMFDAVARVLCEASTTLPLIVVFEDVHWASSTSIALLCFVAKRVEEGRILLVGTYRSSGATQTKAFRDALAELSALPRAHPAILLEGLDVEEVARLASRETGANTPPRLARAIHARTAGNPLFVRELARYLPRDWDQESPAADPLEQFEMPATVQRVVQARTDRLSPKSQSILRSMAVFGMETPLAVLRTLIRGDDDTLFSCLEEAKDAGILSPTEGRGWRFHHPVVRSSIYDDLSARQRSNLHLRAAQAIESVYGADLEPHVAELAFHFVEALPEGDARRAAMYARWAGDQAQTRGAFAEAARHYEKALLSQDFADLVEPADRCDLLLAMAESRTFAGEGEEAMAAIRRAAAISREIGDGDRLARCALAMGAFARPFVLLPELVSLTEEALARLGDEDSPMRLVVHAQLALLEQFSHHEDRAKVLLEDVLQRARRVHAPEARVEILLRHLQVLQYDVGGDPENRLPLANDILVQASMLGRGDLVLEARRSRIGLLLEMGDGAGLDRELASFETDAVRSGRFDMRHYAAAMLAMRALHRGDFVAARARMAETKRFANPFDPTQTLFTPVTQQTLIPLDEPGMHRLRREVEGIIASHPNVVGWLTARMNIASALGDRTEASKTLDFFARDSFSWLMQDLNLIPTLAFCAATASWLGDRARCEILADRLAKHSPYNVVLGWGVACYGPVTHYLGLLSASLERRSEAIGHFESARDANEKQGAETWRIRSCIELARLLAHSPRSNERRQGHALAEKTARDAIDLGLDLDAVAADAVARSA